VRSSGALIVTLSTVMPGLVPGIHAFLSFWTKDVDGRDKPGHDENREVDDGVFEYTCRALFSHGMIRTNGNKGFACASFF
jgi:hypothetical protein